MFEAIKRTLLAGVGAAVITKEKAQSALDDLVARGKVTAREAGVIADRLARDGRREFDSVSTEVSDALEEIVAASANRTEARLRRMRERMREMQSRGKRTTQRPRAKHRKTARPARTRARTKRSTA